MGHVGNDDDPLDDGVAALAMIDYAHEAPNCADKLTATMSPMDLVYDAFMAAGTTGEWIPVFEVIVDIPLREDEARECLRNWASLCVFETRDGVHVCSDDWLARPTAGDGLATIPIGFDDNDSVD